MSRSGYGDYYFDNWDVIRWRGAVASAIRGRRGQAFLKEMLAALDALPEKKLVREDLENEYGVCALGAVGRMRGLDMSQIDPEDPEQVIGAFKISNALAREIMWYNDDAWWHLTDEQRFEKMRNWVAKKIKADNAADRVSSSTDHE